MLYQPTVLGTQTTSSCRRRPRTAARPGCPTRLSQRISPGSGATRRWAALQMWSPPNNRAESTVYTRYSNSSSLPELVPSWDHLLKVSLSSQRPSKSPLQLRFSLANWLVNHVCDVPSSRCPDPKVLPSFNPSPHSSSYLLALVLPSGSFPALSLLQPLVAMETRAGPSHRRA